jgi:hypothetical protein
MIRWPILRRILAFTSVFVVTLSAQANPEREFIMSCTYGVLAGTLVGAASLAFVDQPGDNLQYVARGASIGLYLGIGLGVYTAYVLPKQIQKEEEQKLDNETSGEGQSYLPRFMLFPVASSKGIDGVGAIWQISRF